MNAISHSIAANCFRFPPSKCPFSSITKTLKFTSFNLKPTKMFNFACFSSSSLPSNSISEDPVITPIQPKPKPWLIVGLGNPGKKYSGTRHNVGFEMVDTIAEAEGISINSVSFKASFGKGYVGNVPVILLKPQTFMNVSGESVGPMASYYKIPLQQVLLIYDDMDLPFAKLRLLPKGGHGGHNGMRSVVNHFKGSRDFPRLRIGIGRPSGKMDPATFVLRPFTKQERQEVFSLLDIWVFHLAIKDLSVHDCDCLVEKITKRISTWGSQHLSYAVRTVLVQSILMSLHTYWASIFLIPKTVINRINQVCRSFLWGGSSDSKRVPLIAWTDVCVPKVNGGLGIRSCELGNLAVMGKLLWQLANKEDILWIRWINHIYLHNVDIWQHSLPSNAAWSWKQLCRIRILFHDAYASNYWQRSGGYTAHKGYSGLKTKARLVKFGIGDGLCGICGVQAEESHHLFFACTYSEACWKQWSLTYKIPGSTGNWYSSISSIRHMQGSRFQKKVLYAAAAGLVYAIWRVRNIAIWEMKVLKPEVVIAQLHAELRFDVTMQNGVEAVRILLVEGFNKSATFVNSAKPLEQFS